MKMSIRHTILCMTALLIIFGITSVPAPVHAQTMYYVAPNGLPTNTGLSPSSPWTIARALQFAPSGSIVNFLAGTYRISTNLYMFNPLTLQPYEGAEVLIKGSMVIPDGQWLPSGDDWVYNSYSYEFPPEPWKNPLGINPDYPLADYGDMVFINGTSLRQVASASAVVPGTFYADYAANRLYIGTNPYGKTVEVTVKDNFLVVSEPNTVIRGFKISHFAQFGLGIADANVLVENSEFTWNGETGIQVYGTYGIEFPAPNLTVRDNIFRYNGLQGLAAHQANYLTIENNIVTDNNVENFSTGWAAAGIKINTSDYAVFRNNTVENNNGAGIWLDVGADNATIISNRVANNNGVGIFFEISNTAIIAGNLSINNRQNIYVASSSNARVFNNTSVGGGFSFRVAYEGRSPEPWEEGAGATYITENVVAMNNIFANGMGLGGPNVMIDTWRPDHPSCPAYTRNFIALDYNLYSRVGGGAANLYRWTDPPACYSIFANLSNLRAATGYEGHGIELTAAQPLFVNAAGGDYRLAAGSPAIGAGQPLPADIAALLGIPFGQCTDIGALQTNTCAATPTPSPTATLMPTATATASPTVTPSVTPSPTITPTSTPIIPTVTPSATTLVGVVALQGRANGSPAMSVPLTVELYQGAVRVYSFTPTTDTSGRFSIDGVAAGTYLVWVKHQQYLAVMQSVTMPTGGMPINFGQLKAGDANNDNVVTLLDFSLIASNFGRTPVHAEYDGRANLNADGSINLLDFSLLSNNFNQVGAARP
jgi:hypothetical protein